MKHLEAQRLLSRLGKDSECLECGLPLNAHAKLCPQCHLPKDRRARLCRRCFRWGEHWAAWAPDKQWDEIVVAHYG